jgi:hypothetical protein
MHLAAAKREILQPPHRDLHRDCIRADDPWMHCYDINIPHCEAEWSVLIFLSSRIALPQSCLFSAVWRAASLAGRFFLGCVHYAIPAFPPSPPRPLHPVNAPARPARPTFVTASAILLCSSNLEFDRRSLTCRLLSIPRQLWQPHGQRTTARNIHLHLKRPPSATVIVTSIFLASERSIANIHYGDRWRFTQTFSAHRGWTW